MAFGDVLSGLADASHQHATTLLQMDYQNKREMADKYGKIAEDHTYPEDVRAEALKRAITIHTIEPGKKLPKEFESFSFTVQPKAPTPITTPGSEGTNAQSVNAGGEEVPQYATAAVNPQTVQPPTPPPQTTAMAPMSFDEQLRRAGTTARQAGTVKTETDLNEIRQRHEFLKQQFPTLPEPAIAAMATGHAAPNLSFSLPGTMDEKQVMDVTGLQVGPGHYNVRMFNGQWMPTPVEAKTSGGLKFAQNDAGHWVGYTTDQYGKVAVQSDLGLTPPQGVPTASISHETRIVQTPDGGYAEVPITNTTVRQRTGAGGAGAGGAVNAPTPPPGSTSTTAPVTGPVTGANAVAAPTAPNTQATQSTQSTSTSISTRGVTKIPSVGKSQTPQQMENNNKAAAAFDNMIDRLSGVLANADKFSTLSSRLKIRFATDPQHEGRMVIANAASPLSDEESSFAADYLSLGEDINLLRGVFQATGFRGPEAFATQQAQRGLLTGNFAMFKKTMQNTLKASVDQLSQINKAMTEAGRPLPLTTGIRRAFMLLNNGNANAAAEAALKAGWQVQ